MHRYCRKVLCSEVADELGSGATNRPLFPLDVNPIIELPPRVKFQDLCFTMSQQSETFRLPHMRFIVLTENPLPKLSPGIFVATNLRSLVDGIKGTSTNDFWIFHLYHLTQPHVEYVPFEAGMYVCMFAGFFDRYP